MLLFSDSILECLKLYDNKQYKSFLTNPIVVNLLSRSSTSERDADNIDGWLVDNITLFLEHSNKDTFLR